MNFDIPFLLFIKFLHFAQTNFNSQINSPDGDEFEENSINRTNGLTKINLNKLENLGKISCVNYIF